MPSRTVINFSRGVIIDSTRSSILSAYLKSLLVTIPFTTPSSTTGIPDIFNSPVSCFNWPIVCLELIVVGSRTTPLSYFFTFLTAFDCSWIEQFLCRIPIPPASARAIAILYSVTVSIAADNNGKLISIFFVRDVFTDAWLGRKSQ